MQDLKDEVLLIECKLAVQREKRSTAEVLEYLSEIDRRRLWIQEGYSSLFDFCMRYLNYSEGETQRRIQACRLSVKVETVKPLLEEGSLSLTTMSLLSPFLTNENAKEILPKVVSQPTREVEKILTAYFPEKAKKPEILKIEIDSELKALLEEAERMASEKDAQRLLKKVLKNYIRERKPRTSRVKRHTRYIPQHLAREVKKQSDYQCTFTSSKGIKCNQRARLQKDHIRPFAKGGSSLDKDNLTLLCRAHNLYKAKQDFPNQQTLRATLNLRAKSP